MEDVWRICGGFMEARNLLEFHQNSIRSHLEFHQKSIEFQQKTTRNTQIHQNSTVKRTEFHQKPTANPKKSTGIPLEINLKSLRN